MSRLHIFDALAGLFAAALALGTAELMTGLTGANSLIVAVGNFFVDYTPAPIVKVTIELLGTNDKPFILTSVVVVTLLLAALLGPIARRHRYVALAAFAGFGLAGALAGARDPLFSQAVSFVNAAVAAALGWWTFRFLLDAATLAPAPTSDRSAAATPGRALADRRRFLTFAGAALGGTALTTFVGRSVPGLGFGVDVEAQRRAIVLPPSKLTTPLPSTPGIPVPGQSSLITPNDQFYRIDTALFRPRVDLNEWTLRIKGMVDRPFELTFDELLDMATIEQSITLACVSNPVGGGLVGNAVWLGVPLATLLERAGVQQHATQIIGRSVDRFTAGFPTEVALDGRAAIVAIGMNGEPLPASHGFPARLIVPGLYGYVSATKWLRDIELTRFDTDGYWISRGWSKIAPVKTQSRIDVPRAGEAIIVGKQPIAGVAWGGVRSIDRVEVRVTPTDGEPGEWREARLGEKLTQSSWRQWHLEWDAPPGSHTLEVRATDGDGETQTPARHEPFPSGATGHHRIRVHAF